MSDSDLPVVVIGAGVVGLACAVELARRGRWVIVVEKEPTYGRGTSSRNSEVIHAGIYYATGSLKARFCVEGRDRLYAYLSDRDLPHRRCGKLIVATEQDEVPELSTLYDRALANGAGELEILERWEVAEMEPAARAVAALLSPATGILDVHELMHAFAADAQAAGVDFAFRMEVVAAELRLGGEWRLRVRSNDSEEEIEAAAVVNAAGLNADTIARIALPEADLPRQRWVKGNYFSIRRGSAVQAERLIYPVPPRHLKGLGVHLTRDLGGGLRLGPDVEVIGDTRSEDYGVAEDRRDGFFHSARRFLPALLPEDLSPAYSGLRPQLAQETGFRDFYIAEESHRGAPGWVNLIGIESPGLTCAFSIGSYVAGLVME